MIITHGEPEMRIECAAPSVQYHMRNACRQMPCVEEDEEKLVLKLRMQERFAEESIGGTQGDTRGDNGGIGRPDGCFCTGFEVDGLV